MSTQRTIIFGDVHGCHKEWQALMDKLKVTPADRLISVGDLVSKGPSTAKTLDLAMSLTNLECVLGNHEQAYLYYRKKGRFFVPAKDYQQAALEAMGDRFETYMDYIESWPLYIQADDFIVVHAGIHPGIPLEEQSMHDLTTLRTLPPDHRPWYEDYDGEKLIVHGHWAAQGVVVRDNVIGLDSGCVYGKELTALILPERELVSVPAEKTYCPIT